jgi:hypothetical protein
MKPGRGVQPLPGMTDPDMPVAIAVEHIVALADFISHDENGGRVLAGINLLITTGQWITIDGTRATVVALLGITS